MNTLGDAYPLELQRVRELLEEYRELGPVGRLGAIVIKDVLVRAEKALAEGDTVAMIRLYKELQGCK